MMKDEQPSPEQKETNIREAILMLIKMGKFNPKPWNIDKIEEIIDKPEILHPVDDSEPCKGRQCLRCEGCDSFRVNISNLRDVNEQEEDGGEEEHLEAAEHALNDAFDQMERIAGAIRIYFSKWEITKMVRDSIMSVLDVDIFVLRSNVIKQKEYELDKEKWETVRLFMILCTVDNFFADISAVPKDNKYTFFNVTPNGRYYLPGKMLFMKEEDGKVKYPTIAEYIQSLPINVCNNLKLLQEDLNSRVERLAKWTAEFQ